MNILHLDASITGENSASRELTAAIVDRLRADHPQATVQYRDLVAQPLPHLTLAEYPSEASQAAMADFQAAEIIVIGAPMYNFSIPSQLKAWFDRVLVAGQTFRYTENGPVGLAGGKRVFVAVTRGNYYSEDTVLRGAEHAERYLATMLGFIGITDPVFIVAEGLAIGPDVRESSMRQAHERIGTQVAAAVAGA